MGESSKKPIVSRLIKTFNIDVNILSGSIDTLQATNVGHLILEIIGEEREVDKALDYLENENVNVEVI